MRMRARLRHSRRVRVGAAVAMLRGHLGSDRFWHDSSGWEARAVFWGRQPRCRGAVLGGMEHRRCKAGKLAGLAARCD